MTFRLSARLPINIASFLLIGFFFTGHLQAQQILEIHNPFSSVFVQTGQKSGRFWFAAGPQFQYARYLYHGSKTEKSITSNLVFRVERNGQTSYFCNTPTDFQLGGRPLAGANEVPFLPYDTIRRSSDTIEVVWNDVAGYEVIMRFVAEQPQDRYDDGADILLEFDYRKTVSFGSSTLGIFLMLDGDNGAASGSIGGDVSSIMTSEGYFAGMSRGRVFRSSVEGVPEFYHVGNFEYNSSIPNDLLPVHRLRGLSNGGNRLDEPDVFGVGNWRNYRLLAWNPSGTETVSDIATAMQWENLETEGRIRTAFGTTSREGNNLYHCRDAKLFIDAGTVRVVRQETLGEPYSPDVFDVDMWVSNTDMEATAHPEIELPETFTFAPQNQSRMHLDPSTPSRRSLELLPGETKKITWRLHVDSVAADTLVSIPIYYRDATFGVHAFRRLLDSGAIRISFATPLSPSRDLQSPVLQQTGIGSKSEWRTIDVFDRHTGSIDDSGIDSIRILRNDADNIVQRSLAPFQRCDTTATIPLEFRVRDTTKPAFILFRVHDCAGNSALDSMKYRPRPDIYKPQIFRIDSIGGRNPAIYPCATPTFEVYLEDRTHLTDSTSDAGLGSVNVLSGENFHPLEINFDRGDVPIEPLSPTASFRLRVIDTLFPAHALIEVIDFAGNVDTFRFEYCSIATSVAVDDPSRQPGPIIRSVRPQPFGAASGSALVLEAENVGADAYLELISVEGEVLMRVSLQEEIDLTRRSVDIPLALPREIPSGVYQLRLVSAKGGDDTTIIVTD